MRHEFNLRKIYFPQWHSKQNETDSILDSEILNQQFSYLDKGSQFYVFESQDEKFVIKFMRYDKIQYPRWAMLFSNFQFSKRKINKKKKRFLSTLKSSLFASNSNLNFGILSHNIDGKVFRKSIVVLDKYKNKIKVDLDKSIFLIQKKAIKLKDALSTSNQKMQMSIISNFLKATQRNLNRKIYNNTKKCMDNVGVCDGEIIEFDVGDIHYFEQLYDTVIKNSYFKRFVRPMREYLLKEQPNLVSYFDKEEKQLCNQL